jgi:aspartokinase
MASVFDACVRAAAAPRLAAVGDSSVAVVVEEGAAADRVEQELGAAAASRRDGLALIAVVGDGLAAGTDAVCRVLRALDGTPVHLLSRTPGANHVACVIDPSHLTRLVGAVHACLFDTEQAGTDDDVTLSDTAAGFRPSGAAGREARA